MATYRIFVNKGGYERPGYEQYHKPVSWEARESKNADAKALQRFEETIARAPGDHGAAARLEKTSRNSAPVTLATAQFVVDSDQRDRSNVRLVSYHWIAQRK